MVDSWAEGDAVCLIAPREAPRIVRLARGPQRVGGDSVLDLTEQIGRPVGGEVPWLGATYRAVRPSLSDLLTTLHRGAQIVTAKDAAQILLLAGVAPGGRVAEAGSGSGALTLVLASAVGPGGHVLSCDRRPEFLENARSNVARAGWGDRVEFRRRDVALEGWGEDGFTSVVLDLAEPWQVVTHAEKALVPGGIFLAYLPTINQTAELRGALERSAFAMAETFEILRRTWHIEGRSVRPDHRMVAHTGFITHARLLAA